MTAQRTDALSSTLMALQIRSTTGFMRHIFAILFAALLHRTVPSTQRNQSSAAAIVGDVVVVVVVVVELTAFDFFFFW